MRLNLTFLSKLMQKSGKRLNVKSDSVLPKLKSGKYYIQQFLVLGFVLIGMSISTAQAQSINQVKKWSSSRNAALVMDMNTGKTLYAYKADTLRYPASLTKMMTLYVLFDQLKAGKLKLSSKLKVSRNAASKPASKLGVRAGSTITAEQAISALAVKSANDVATVVAENISGSESKFAVLMTSTARKLGMKSSTFKNASGLPSSSQKVTARDMAKLAHALIRNHGNYYKYFSQRSFTYNKAKYSSHNRLLGRVKGVDGIKTGYTRASGFNLVTSMHSGNRHIIAVVLGGPTSASRDNYMKTLINTYISNASAKYTGWDKSNNVYVANSVDHAEVRTALTEVGFPTPRSSAIVSEVDAIELAVLPTPKPDEIGVTSSPNRSSAFSSEEFADGRDLMLALAPEPRNSPDNPKGLISSTSLLKIVESVKKNSPRVATISATPKATFYQPPARPQQNVEAVVKPNDAVLMPDKNHWLIEIGTFNSELDAVRELHNAWTKSKNAKAALGNVGVPYVEKVQKGENTFYRARISNLKVEQAYSSCEAIRNISPECKALVSPS